MQEMGKRKRDVGAGVGKWEAREGGSVGVAYIYLSFFYVCSAWIYYCLLACISACVYIYTRSLHTYIRTYIHDYSLCIE